MPIDRFGCLTEPVFIQSIGAVGNRTYRNMGKYVWKLEDAWWTEKPQELIYFKLDSSGRELTVCHDLVRDDWRLCR